MPFFFGDLRVEQNLQEQITQLIFDFVPFSSAQSALHFPGFLAQERDQRQVRLLAIPRAALRRAQAGDQADEPLYGLCQF